MNNKYLYFSDVCLDGKIQCKESYEIGLQIYNELSLITNGRTKRNKKAKSSWEFAHASETALKAFLIYTEFTNMEIFNNPKTINRSSGENCILLRSEKDKNGNIRDVYSMGFYPGYQEHNQIWKKLLDGRRDELPISEQSRFSDKKSFGMIGDPRILLTSIRQHALDGDFRLDKNFMIDNPIHSYDFTKIISGHDLFAYLKIQNPAEQGIINNELFLLGNNYSKEEKIIGILEGYGNSSIQNNSNQEIIYANSLTFPKRRFDWITGEEISDIDLKSILDFAKINLDVAEFKFPGDDIEKIENITKVDFFKYNHTVFKFLDPICKHYVREYFTNEEINVIDTIAKIEQLKASDIVMFVNMCVYYKYYIREILQDKSQILNFDKSEHAKNLLVHTSNMKLYDANGTAKLEESPVFIANIGNVSNILSRIKEENNKLNETAVTKKIEQNDKKIENSLKTTLVHINDAAISTSEKPIVGTDALSTCTGILLYNEDKKTAIVAHVVPGKIDAIEKMFQIIIKNKLWSTKFKYLIITGYYQEHYNTKELIERHLTNMTPFRQDEIPENAIITNEEFNSREFAFDATTGKFVTDRIFFGKDYYKVNEKESNISKYR